MRLNFDTHAAVGCSVVAYGKAFLRRAPLTGELGVKACLQLVLEVREGEWLWLPFWI